MSPRYTRRDRASSQRVRCSIAAAACTGGLRAEEIFNVVDRAFDVRLKAKDYFEELAPDVASGTVIELHRVDPPKLG